MPVAASLTDTNSVPTNVGDGVAPSALAVKRSTQVCCQEIVTSDLEDVIKVLTVGYAPRQDRAFWVNAIKRLSEHVTPPGLPKYGYLLRATDNSIVGVLLMIFSSRVVDGAVKLRCNCSSIYVEPAFRAYAPLLVKRALRCKDVTYLNITAARHTWQMLEAQGYSRFSDGLFVALPALSWSSPSIRVQTATPEKCRDTRLEPFEADLLLAHANFGCISLLCEAGDLIYPFVFGLIRKFGFPLARLAYCRDQKDFVWLSGPLGRFLIKRGYPLVVLDANGPIPGLLGRYSSKRPKYCLGPERPRLGDLAYTERVMFGF